MLYFYLTYDKIESNDDESETVTKPGIVIKEDPVVQEENVIVITKIDENGNLLSGADFEVSGSLNSDKNILKEYSINGIDWYVWNYEVPNYNAVYFRFSGLYDFVYTLTEIKTPLWYVGMEDKTYDFINLEGQFVEETIMNNSIKGEIIVHYVVKVGDEYIPFEKFAYDEDGNLITMFAGVNIEDVVLSGKIGEEFETNYEVIDGLTLNGLYIGNNSDNLNKIVNDRYVGTFKEDIQEFTYVFEINVGVGEDTPLPPQTGYDFNINYFRSITLYCISK